MAVYSGDGSEIWTQIAPIINAANQNPSSAAPPPTPPIDPSNPPPPGPSGPGNSVMPPITPPSAGATGSYVPNGTTPNSGQIDQYGNVYYPINNAAWNGQYLDPTQFPKVSQVNQQLWGGPTTDSPPQWFQSMIAKALAMPDGAAKTAYIQHIMSSLSTMGANQYDVAYADNQFGLTPTHAGGV